METKELKPQKLKYLEVKNFQGIVIGRLTVDIDNKEILLDGLPFKQASHARSLLAAAMIQIEQHPMARFCVFKNASMIGARLRQEIYGHAFNNGYTAIFESLDSSDLPGIVIENGVSHEISEYEKGCIHVASITRDNGVEVLHWKEANVCPRCGKMFCDDCFDEERGICIKCTGEVYGDSR